MGSRICLLDRGLSLVTVLVAGGLGLVRVLVAGGLGLVSVLVAGGLGLVAVLVSGALGLVPMLVAVGLGLVAVPVTNIHIMLPTQSERCIDLVAVLFIKTQQKRQMDHRRRISGLR